MELVWFSPRTVLLIIIFSILSNTHVHCQSNTFKVTDAGAVSGGQDDNKKAFLDTWQKSCKTNGGTMVIPQGTYLVSSAEFVGPCNGQTNVIVNGTVKASPSPVPNIDYWIMFRDINGLSVYGKGTFDGNGASYWTSSQRLPALTSIKFESIINGKVQDITSVNSKMFHMGFHNCLHLNVNNINIRAPQNSPNTDGIHIGSSSDARITNANIATGDDCISMGDGTTNMNITGVTCGPGHGISIGSLGRYPNEKDVSSITVTNCTLSNTDNGVRIKTVAPSPPGRAYGITFHQIIMNNVRNPIIIDQHYCPTPNHCQRQAESSVSIKQVKFIDVQGSSSSAVGVKIDCSKNQPCQDIELSGVKLNFQGKPTTASCSNAGVKFLGNLQVPSKCS